MLGTKRNGSVAYANAFGQPLDIQKAVKPYLWVENKQIKILPNNAKL